MAYVNPAELFAGNFKPKVQAMLPIVPSLIASDRTKIAQEMAQKQFESQAPLRAAQTNYYNVRAAELMRKALQDYANLNGADTTIPQSLLPPGLTPESYISGVKQGVLPKIEYPKQGKEEQMVDTPYGQMPASQAYHYIEKLKPPTERKPELKGMLNNGSPVVFMPDVGLMVNGKEPYNPEVHGEVKPIAQERPYFPVVYGPGGAYQVDTRNPGSPAIPVTVPGTEAGSPNQPLKKTLPTAEAQELADLKVTHDRLVELKDMSEKLKSKFGPIEGNWNKLKIKFLEDGDVTYLSNELESLITMAYGLSGKQISYIEMQMLKKAIIPQMTQPYANFRATLDFATKWIDSTHDNRLQYYNQSGFGSNIKPLGQEDKGKPKPSAIKANKWGKYDTEGEGTSQKPTEAKPITKEVAAQYLQQYGDRKAAEEAARRDGYTW